MSPNSTMQTPFSLNRPIIYPLFSTPIYYVPDTKIQIDSTLLTRLLDKTEFPDFVETAGLSKNQFILDNPDFKDIRRVCELHLQEYTTQVCGLDNEFYITNSWLSRNEPNIDHPPHAHINSIFSGCLYLKSSQNSELSFGSLDQLSKTWPLAFNRKRINIYNATSWSVPVDTGAIVIWPSNVFHSSNPNPLKDTRVVMCFNTFIRGDLTDPTKYVTNLVLK